MSSSINQSIPSSLWIRCCAKLWHLQSYIWGTVILGLIVNLVSSFLTEKGGDLMGTPLGWLIIHPLFLTIGLLLILGQTVLAFWGNKRKRVTNRTILSSSTQLEQRDRDILKAIGKAVQAQPGPQLPTAAALRPFLQDRYPKQDIIDSLEYFHEIGDVRLFKAFGDPLNWSFQLTPTGKRKLIL